MKKILLIAFSALALASCGSKNTVTVPATPPELHTQIDTLSWAYGQNIASVLQTGFFNELDADLIIQSALYTLKGGTQQPLTPEMTRQIIDYIMLMYNSSAEQADADTRQKVDQAQEEYFQRLTSENPNVKRHPKGFYYEVLKAGKGPNAYYGQRIEFDYRSYIMLTGQPYDQTYGKRDPIIHVVAEPMFPGLIDAFQLMNAGSIYRFYFPYHLAFGSTGSDGIPPYTPLIYEVELHKTFDD